MPLIEVTLPGQEGSIPADVRKFLKNANRRIHRFLREHHLPNFLPSEYRCVYHALHALAWSEAATGPLFCEWGSGFSVVACLAAMLGFDAVGIEKEAELVEASLDLAADFEIPLEVIHDSFIPADAPILREEGYSWLTGSEGMLEKELDLTLEDFNVIYVYPWPDEEQVFFDLFESYASEGALLLTYHSLGEVHARRKV